MLTVTQTNRDGGAVVDTPDLHRSLLEQQLDAMEHPRLTRQPRWPWVLVLAGALAIIGLGFHGYLAYTTIRGVNDAAKVATANPVILFQDVATNGPQVGSSVPTSSRATYARALNQFALDGTGICVGLALVVAGLFVRVNTR